MLEAEYCDAAIKAERGGRLVRLCDVGKDEEGECTKPSEDDGGCAGGEGIVGAHTSDDRDMDEERAGCIDYCPGIYLLSLSQCSGSTTIQ